MKLLLLVAALTCLIHLVNTLTYSVRLSGVRTRKLATAHSLYNVIFLLSSTANSIQIPLMAAVIERVINLGEPQVNQLLSAGQLAMLEQQMRLVMGAATVGTLIGAAIIPVFVLVFIGAIELFEESGSAPRLIGRVLLAPRSLLVYSRRVTGSAGGPAPVRPKLPLPKAFIGLNALVTGIYTTGVLSAIYAAALYPDVRTTASVMSPVINGVATVLAAAVVDPTAAAITDQALSGERHEEDVKRMTFYLSLSRILGTLLAQAFFLPAAYLIKTVAVWLCS